MESQSIRTISITTEYKKDDNCRSMTDVGGVDAIKEFEVNSLNDVYLRGYLIEKRKLYVFTQS